MTARHAAHLGLALLGSWLGRLQHRCCFQHLHLSHDLAVLVDALLTLLLILAQLSWGLLLLQDTLALPPVCIGTHACVQGCRNPQKTKELTLGAVKPCTGIKRHHRLVPIGNPV
jgi:hypothetical protein